MFHRKMLAPINTNKHYVHQTNIAVTSGAVNTNLVSEAVVAPATANAFSVEEGSVIKAVYVEMWCVGNGAAGTNSQFNYTIEKLPGATPVMTAAQQLNLGAYQNKKNVLFHTQAVIGGINNGTNPVPMYRGWIRIPKGKQRQGLDDRIATTFQPVGADCRICGFFTYKEFR